MKHSLSLANKALLCAFFANVMFGFSFIFTRLALGYASPYVLLTCRFFVALVVFTIILFVGRISLSLRGKPWWSLLFLGVLQPILYFIGETYGVLYTTATFSAIMIALIPIVSIWASALVLRESPTFRQSIFCCLSVLGVIVITANSGGGSNQLIGVLLLLLAVLADVAFFLLTRKLSITFTPFERTYMMFVIGFIAFFTLMLVETKGSLTPLFEAFATPALWLPVLYLGIASSVVAFFLINYASTLLPVTRTIVFINVTTIVSVFAGVFFLHEQLSPLSLVAIGAIIVGIWGVQHFAKGDASPPPALSEEAL